MPVDHQQIAPTIIVKIEYASSERTIQDIRLSYRRSDRVIRECSVSIVAIQPVQFKVKMADEEIQQPVIHHVRGVRAHSCFGPALLAESRAGFVRRIAKRSISVVQVQEIALRIVRNENDRPADPI